MDLGGVTPVDPRVRGACSAAVERLVGAGVPIEEACPDFAGAARTFQVLRGIGFAGAFGPIYERQRHMLKPDIVWNVEFGLKLTPAEIGAAERHRGALYHRTLEFFRSYDLLVCPAAAVPPFDVKTRWLREIDGVALDTYMSWLYITAVITLTACPVLSLPCGFTDDGLPVGLQLIAPPRGEAALLSAAAACEEALGVSGAVPIDPRRNDVTA
jgi:amidase